MVGGLSICSENFVSCLRSKVLCSLHDFGCWLVGISIKMKVPLLFLFFFLQS